MFGEKTDQAETERIIHGGLDAGINLIYLSDVYAGGGSERMVGAAISVHEANRIAGASPLASRKKSIP